MRHLLVQIYITFEKKLNILVVFKLRNFLNKLRGQGHRFLFDPSLNLPYVLDSSIKHYFGDARRGLGLYVRGIEFRKIQLWNSYCLDQITFEKDDLVIDCGANYADLWLNLRKHIFAQNYITFEPGNSEYKCILLNSLDGKHYQIGLGNENRELTFYVNSESADSSFIEPLAFTAKIKAQTMTLDEFFKAQELTKVKLLKLEAEGFEPEILEGAKQSLKLISFVAIDGGPERGISQTQTFSQLTNFLYSMNFQMVAVGPTGWRALFQNSNTNHEPRNS